MSDFDKRKVELQPTCFTCEHSCALGDMDEDDCFYCMLGLSTQDRDHVKDIVWGGYEYDESFRETMKLGKPSEGYWDSPRLVKLDNVCQFYKSDDWRS